MLWSPISSTPFGTEGIAHTCKHARVPPSIQISVRDALSIRSEDDVNFRAGQLRLLASTPQVGEFALRTLRGLKEAKEHLGFAAWHIPEQPMLVPLMVWVFAWRCAHNDSFSIRGLRAATAQQEANYKSIGFFELVKHQAMHSACISLHMPRPCGPLHSRSH